jgi:uncharacterized protein YyaL (SSP411 family)
MQRILAAFRQTLIPRHTIACRGTGSGALRSAALDPLFADKGPLTESPVVYVCQGSTCQAPVQGVENILALWRSLAESA